MTSHAVTLAPSLPCITVLAAGVSQSAPLSYWIPVFQTLMALDHMGEVRCSTVIISRAKAFAIAS